MGVLGLLAAAEFLVRGRPIELIFYLKNKVLPYIVLVFLLIYKLQFFQQQKFKCKNIILKLKNLN